MSVMKSFPHLCNMYISFFDGVKEGKYLKTLEMSSWMRALRPRESNLTLCDHWLFMNHFVLVSVLWVVCFYILGRSLRLDISVIIIRMLLVFHLLVFGFKKKTSNSRNNSKLLHYLSVHSFQYFFLSRHWTEWLKPILHNSAQLILE